VKTEDSVIQQEAVINDSQLRDLSAELFPLLAVNHYRFFEEAENKYKFDPAAAKSLIGERMEKIKTAGIPFFKRLRGMFNDNPEAKAAGLQMFKAAERDLEYVSSGVAADGEVIRKTEVLTNNRINMLIGWLCQGWLYGYTPSSACRFYLAWVSWFPEDIFQN
jgi:hypothetical protein